MTVGVHDEEDEDEDDAADPAADVDAEGGAADEEEALFSPSAA